MQQLQVLEWIKGNTGRAYQEFMEGEGIPIYEDLGGVSDPAELPMRPWARMGGEGTFIKLLGTSQADVGLYALRIPGGEALNPVKHLYNEEIFVLQGRGLMEVWNDGGDKVTFEWGQGSVFSPPLNTWHRMINGSREPALYFAVNTAPRLMNMVYDNDFIFDCDFQFTDRFGGQSDYFTEGENKFKFGAYAQQTIWETNFIPDALATFLEADEHKVAGGNHTGYRMGKHWPNGHISQWPVGVYHKAHYHGPGAVLLGLRAEGYVLLWPRELGAHPYENGHGDQVVKVNWGPRSIYTPPAGWYHQHFNTGKEPARHIAVYGRDDRPEAVWSRSFAKGQDLPLLVSNQEGGTLIDYEDEDPQIRVDFVNALKKKGIECTMAPAVYRK